MTDASPRAAADTVTYLLPVTLSAVVPIATLPIITRLVPPADYGAWAMASVYALFLTGFANCGLPLTVDRNLFAQKDERGKGRLLYSVLLFVAASLGAGLLLTWWQQDRLAAWLTGSTRHGHLLLLATAAQAVLSLKAYYLLYYRQASEARTYVRFSMDETVLATAFTLVLLLLTSAGVLALPLGQLSAAALVFTAATRRFLRRVPFEASFQVLLPTLRMSYPLTANVLLGVVGKNADKYFLGQAASITSVGVYAIGQRVAMLVFSFMTALENVFVPGVYRRMFAKESGDADQVGAYLTPFLYTSVAGALAVAVFAPEALLVLTPPEYHASAWVIGILSVGYSVMFFGKQPQLLHAGKTHLNAILSASNIVVSVSLNYVLVVRFGLAGAAMAMLGTAVLSTGMFMALGQRHYRIDWEWGKLIACFAWLALSVAFVSIITLLGVSWPVALPIKVALIAGYAGLGIRIGVITRQGAGEALRALRAKAGVPGGAGRA